MKRTPKPARKLPVVRLTVRDLSHAELNEVTAGRKKEDTGSTIPCDCQHG